MARGVNNALISESNEDNFKPQLIMHANESAGATLLSLHREKGEIDIDRTCHMPCQKVTSGPEHSGRAGEISFVSHVTQT